MSDDNGKIPNETKSVADMLTDMGLSRDSTYLYERLPTVSHWTYLTDGAKGYYWGFEDDGTEVDAIVEYENWFPYTWWVDPFDRIHMSHQGPYYLTTWDESRDGVVTHQPRTKQYPTPPPTNFLIAMASARRLKRSSGKGNDLDDVSQGVDDSAVLMTDEGLRQSASGSTDLLSLQNAHEQFKQLVGRQAEADSLRTKDSESQSQQSAGYSSVEGSQVPGAWPKENE